MSRHRILATTPKTARVTLSTPAEADLRIEATSLKIGTWNLDGRWQDGHRELMASAACDVWLLTEVNPSVELPGYQCQLTSGVMRRGQHWAGVYSRRPLLALAQPHLASAAATVDGITFCSSILPWRGLGRDAGWPGDTHEEWTTHAVDRLLGRVLTKRVVWGGDWNHGIFGPESIGSKGGRRRLLSALSRLELNVPTAHLPHRIPGLLSIDHIAVPADWTVSCVKRIATEGLSDHDCYVVQTDLTGASLGAGH